MSLEDQMANAMTRKTRVEQAYNLFLEVMNEEGFVYYDIHDVDLAKPTWVEIIRTDDNYDTIVYAVPESDWKEDEDA